MDPRSAHCIAVARGREDEFSGDHHVYEPHKVGLPPLGPYFRALWARRQFLYELARTTSARNTSTRRWASSG